MNHPTTIRAVIEWACESYYAFHEYGDSYSESNKETIEEALQDITRIIEDALPDEVLHIDENTGMVTGKVNPYRANLKKVIGE